MLRELFVRNIILIDKIDILFDDGFCALTGETGAGKSVLLGSLGFALGRRSSSSLLRHGEKQGSVTAVFSVENNANIASLLEENAIEIEANELFMRRVIYADGRTKSFVNDTPVKASLLGQLADFLIEIHGQHDQRGLMDSATHIKILDKYGQIDGDVSKLKTHYKSYKDLQKKLKSLQENKNKLLAEEDYLKHVVAELDSLDLRNADENALSSQRKNLMNKDNLVETVNTAVALINDNNVEDFIKDAQNLLLKNANVNDGFAEISDIFDRAAIEVADAIESLERLGREIDVDDGNLEEIEERLFALRDAARKYNTPVEKLPEYMQQVQEKLDFIANQEVFLSDIENQLSEVRSLYIEQSKVVTKRRKTTASKFEKELAAELAPLKMGGTTFVVKIDELLPAAWSENGVDKVIFMASTNAGMPVAPLAKIASGGELSRFMLAVKVVLSSVDSVPTMIFDEVDTGIGGAVSDAVGRRLELLGKKVQTFAITHQPQVAARAGLQFKVKKQQNGAITTTNIIRLSQEERTEELARMLAGEEITGEARAAATKLLIEA